MNPTKRLHGPRGSLLRGCSPAIAGDFLGFLDSARDRYGRAFRIRVAPGWHALGLLAPEHYEHVLARRGDNYVKETREAVMLRNMLGRSVLTDNGQSQRHSRRVAQPALTAPAVHAISPVVGQIVARVVEEWTERFGDGTPFDLQQEMMALTIRIALGALLADDDAAAARQLSYGFWRSNQFLSDRIARPLGPLAAAVPNLRNRRYRRDRRDLNAIVGSIIEAARRSPAGGRLINLLVGGALDAMGEARLRSEVKTFLFSGHETSSTTLTWFWYFLSRDQELERRFFDEIDQRTGGDPVSADQVRSLELTNRIVWEVLRFYPPGYIIGRKAVGDDDALGFRIPKGTQVYMSPYLTHRDPEYWERPTAFDADRFAPEASAGRPRFAYLPFGAGPRRCLGDQFASLELLTIAAMMGRRFRLRPVAPGPVVPEPLLTIRPAGGLPVRLELRAT